jgi:hypothetical protein
MLRTGLSRIEAFEAALAEAGQHGAVGDARSAFAALERAHVLGHWREVIGQVLRIALVPIGHLVGRLPIGNTGGANVSAFKPMAIPPELKRLIEERDR